MFLRYVCTVTLIAFLNSVIGCTSNVKVAMDEAWEHRDEPIHSVGLVSGDKVVFDINGGRLDSKRGVIVGITRAHRLHGKMIGSGPVEIKLSDVKYIKVREKSTTKTLLLTAGILVVVIGAAVIIDLGNMGFSPSGK